MAAIESVRRELVPKIKAFCPSCQDVAPARPLLPAASWSPPKAPRILTQRINIVAIGVSTGGPNALHEVFAHLPGDLPVPLVIVQHMPALFTRHLAERLTAKSKVVVREAAEGDVLTPGGAWVAPGDYHMSFVRQGADRVVKLQQGPPENSCRPAVDVMFRSVAELYGPNALGVVMTGMGQDGLRGCEQIRDRGGQILIQDEESSVVWGMPGAVARAQLADRTLPLSQIAGEIVRCARRGRSLKLSAS